MRSKWLGSITTMLLAAGSALAQAPAPTILNPLSGKSVPTQQPPRLPEDAPPPAVAPLALPPTPNAAGPTDMGSNTCAEPLSLFDNVKHNEFHSGNEADFWFSSEYLLWWLKNTRLPSVVGRASTDDVRRGGELPSVTPIYGDGANNLEYHEQSGVRFSTGFWLNESHTFGFDGNFYQLEQKNQGATITSPGDPVIGPTFFDPNINRQRIILASLPVFTTGPLAFRSRSASITVQNTNRLWGAEVNARYALPALFFMDRLDLLAGFRHLYFGEGFDISTTSPATPGNAAPADVYAADHFGVRNQFYGGQLGLASHGQNGRLSFDGIFKLGLGNVHEVVNVSGQTLITGPGFTPVLTNTGVLAESTNIGHRNTDHFAYLPELNLTLGYQLLPSLRATVGYNFMYLNNVVRAGDQIDGVDARQVRALQGFDPNSQASRPNIAYHTDRFYVQGLNFGLEFAY